MNVIPFMPAASALRSWSPRELEALVSVYETHAARGDASSWDVGATEFEDPQFFVFGPTPELDCIVAISRVGRIYVLENGTGQVLDEGTSLDNVVSRAKAPVTEYKPLGLIARVTVVLTAIRVAFHERIEPFLAESEEVLLRVAPQFAALV
ncbi:MAG TPA: hypothetical protein VH743_05345 [Beijerinckiaceae bacterium]|jgi:hypothetical protein